MNANVTYCVCYAVGLCYAVGFSVIERKCDCKCGCVCVVKSNHKSKWKTINEYLDQNAIARLKVQGDLKLQ